MKINSFLTPLLSLVLAVAMLTSSLAQSQPFNLSAAVAVNDKVHEDRTPLRVALAKHFGAPFIERHAAGEGRRACQWGGYWAECMYLELKDAPAITKAQRETILEFIRDPCASLDENAVREAYKDVLRTNYKSDEAREKSVRYDLKRLNETRQFYISKQSRAVKSSLRTDGIAFEALMQRTESRVR